MIPQGGMMQRAAFREERPSLTWRLDMEQGRIAGKIDGIEAIEQAIYKILQTDRYRHAVYSFHYGHELAKLYGQNPLFVRSEAARMIREAVLADERITSVAGVETSVNGEVISIAFTAMTAYGNVKYRGEVMLGV